MILATEAHWISNVERNDLISRTTHMRRKTTKLSVTTESNLEGYLGRHFETPLDNLLAALILNA